MARSRGLGDVYKRQRIYKYPKQFVEKFGSV
jgi:hypothetical protein